MQRLTHLIFLVVTALCLVTCSSQAPSNTTAEQQSSDSGTTTDGTTGSSGDTTDPGSAGSTGSTGGSGSAVVNDTLETFTPPAFTNVTTPVTSTHFTFSSPFGPRLQASAGYAYDFHRGIDIPGTLGDPIYAIADGEIYSAYEEGGSAYPEGGNVILIEHALDTPYEFQDQMVEKIYSVYMHLNSLGTDALAYITLGDHNTVTKGAQIGTLGDSGTTNFIHLHLETRLGTTCSLEYQIENPTLNCAAYGFDPHINPMTFFVGSVNPDDFSISFTSVTSTNATIEITAPPDVLIVDGVTFEIFATDNGIQTADDSLYSATASFDQRESFDATTTDSLDNPDIDGFTVSPAAFNSSTAEYAITFIAIIPSSVWTGRTEILVKATLRTTLGEVQTVEQVISL